MARKSLGRGLSEILNDVELAYEKELESDSNLVVDIDIDKIKTNPYQPRKYFDEESLKELSYSIKDHGLIQPIIVIQKDDHFILIAGERRLRATKLLNKTKIRAIIADIKSDKLREIALIENIQRENLNPIELANSYKELINEYKITQEELSNIIKKSRAQITNTMRLLNLNQKTQKAIEENKITQGHAKVMVGLNFDEELLVLDTILKQNLSVRETEDLVKKIKLQNSKTTKVITQSYNMFLDDLKQLKTFFKDFGKVSIKNKKITIEFSEITNLQDLLKKINQEKI